MAVVKIVFLAIVSQNLISIHSYDYCRNELELCGSKENRHIECYKEQIEPDAKFDFLYPMTGLFVDWIVYWHNYYRNEIACGEAEGSGGKLPTAIRMRELSWDYELEYLAGLHASRCKLQHDQCRNSKRIPLSGQNLSFEKTSGQSSPPLKRAYDSIEMWFGEGKLVTPALIDKYEKNPELQIGHFTMLANDRVGRVGCAMASCKAFPTDTNAWKSTFMTCNYDYTNVVDAPVYTTGDPANHCTLYGHFDRSSNFTCLCATNFNKRNSTFWNWMRTGTPMYRMMTNLFK